PYLPRRRSPSFFDGAVPVRIVTARGGNTCSGPPRRHRTASTAHGRAGPWCCCLDGPARTRVRAFRLLRCPGGADRDTAPADRDWSAPQMFSGASPHPGSRVRLLALERVEDAAELAARRGRAEAASGPAHREPLLDEPTGEFPVGQRPAGAVADPADSATDE